MHGLLFAGNLSEATPDLPRLSKAMGHYYSAGTSSTTQRLYLAGLKRYITFCSQAKLIPIPTTEATLLLFVTHLANQNLACSTIKVYLAAVHSAHVAQGKHRSFESQLTLCLLLVMKGIRKLTSTSKPPRVRLLITTEILQGINTVLSAEPDSYLNKMMWAACCMAFFGFLHSSEFTVPSQHHYNPEVHLSLSDITLDRRHSPIWSVYILNSLKLTLLGRVLTFIWAELTSRFAQSGQLYPILQCGKQSRASIHSSQWQDAYQGYTWFGT